MVKGIKLEDGRIDEICKDLKRIKTYEGLLKFLFNEIDITCSGAESQTGIIGFLEKLKATCMRGKVNE